MPTVRVGRVLGLQIGLALIVVAAVLAVSFLFERRSFDTVAQNQRNAALARERADAVGHVLTGLLASESGQRGFLLTLRPEYLDTYDAGLIETGAALARLDTLIPSGDPAHAAAASLAPVAGKKLAELARTIDLARRGSRDAALAIVASGEGKAFMDDARAKATALSARLLADRDAFSIDRAAAEARASRDTLVASAIGAILLGAAVLILLLARARARATAAELAARTTLLRDTVDTLPDGVAVFDPDAALILWNERLFEVAGLSRDLARPGTPWARFAAASGAWPQADVGAGTSTAEIAIGARTLEIWRGALSGGGQIVAIADATRRTQAEAIARQAQKMDAVGQLTGGVAHDFNNLLQVISANLELIGDAVVDDPATASRLTAAMSGVDRATRLTRHLLAFARRQPLAPEAIDTPRLLHDFEELLRRTFPETIAIELVRGGGLWPMLADLQQLESALLNLCINARDAMADGGRLTIEVANVALDDRYAAQHAEVTPGQYVAIAVTDTGIGMSAAELARAMEPFYTTKPEGRGTGLGLAMVYGFARQSGGHFTLYSEPGHGTTARLYIPRSTEPPRPFAADEIAQATAGNELVLIVEDDPTVRAASSQAIRGLGYRTAEAESAAAALQMIERGLRPDLLFTDVVMPGRPSARDMADAARAVRPGLAVVFTSGYPQNAIVHNGRLDADVLLLSKPWRIADLARKFRVALLRHAGARHGTGQTPATARILLVEDEPLVRMATAELLADLGHEVTEAGSGREAMAVGAPGHDLLICDLGLPDTDGFSLAEALRAKHPGMRVIVASGREAPAGSGFIWLGKPFDQAGLRAAIDMALAPA